MSFSIQNNTPSVGCIQWSNLNMAYKGITYAIVNGYTNAIYSYWSPSYPNNLIVTNEFPVLTSDECLIFLNKNGTATTVPTASVVSGDLLVPGSVTANALAANTITGDKILAGTISASNIAAGTISSDKIAANAIGASVIAANCITGDKLVADAITAREIASKTVTANEIAAGTITAAEIKALTITATQIAAGTIDASKIKANTITTSQLASNVGAGLDISSNQSITLKASKTELSDAVNGIQIGGRNLILNSAPYVSGWSWAGTAGTASLIDELTAPKGKAMKAVFTAVGTSGGLHKPPISKLEVGKTYTWSVWIKASKVMTMEIGPEQGGKKTVSLITSWQKITHTFTAIESVYFSFVFYAKNTVIGDEYYVHSIMLEEATNPSAWNQAPEDIEARFTSTEVEITPTAIAQKVKEQRAAEIYNVRYIRLWSNGSSANTANHWNEVQVITNQGYNLMRSSAVTFTGSTTIAYGGGGTETTIRDGIIDHSYTQVGSGLQYLQIYLGGLYKNIDNIVVWQYFADGRTYNDTKVEVSEDGVTWYTLFDSAVEGKYVETKNGHSIQVNKSAYSRTGIAQFDDNGLTIKNSDSDTYTQVDSGAFSVNSNTGSTIAEFGSNSIIPNLTSDGIIQGNIVYANNIASKSMSNADTRFIYVDGATGNDSNPGTSASRLKTVQRAIDYMLEDIINDNVTIYVYNSVPGFTLLGKSGSATITFSFQDSAIVNGQINVYGVQSRVNFTNETGSKKSTLKAGIRIHGCRQVDIYALTFRGVNTATCNIYIYGTNFCAINNCDLGGLGTTLMSAIRVDNSTVWTHNLVGSNITDVVAQYAFSFCITAKIGTITVPDYTNGYHVGYDSMGRYQAMAGATFAKTPSAGWNPTYTPSARTTTWTFNKVWSDETLKGWSDKAELIQGYASIWATGRYTGYMQMNDSFAGIRESISGGTNLSGKVYVQRRTTSGNSTGSALCLYGSDGTAITTTTSINQGQGVWVTLPGTVLAKIQSGAINFFYLKADADNPATYFKCESNAQIQITYTK